MPIPPWPSWRSIRYEPNVDPGPTWVRMRLFAARQILPLMPRTAIRPKRDRLVFVALCHSAPSVLSAALWREDAGSEPLPEELDSGGVAP